MTSKALLSKFVKTQLETTLTQNARAHYAWITSIENQTRNFGNVFCETISEELRKKLPDLIKTALKELKKKDKNLYKAYEDRFLDFTKQLLEHESKIRICNYSSTEAMRRVISPEKDLSTCRTIYRNIAQGPKSWGSSFSTQVENVRNRFLLNLDPKESTEDIAATLNKEAQTLLVSWVNKNESEKFL